MRFQISRCIPDFDLLDCAPPIEQADLYARKQLQHAERLDHIVVSTPLKRRDAIDLISASGEHEDATLRLRLENFVDKYAPITVGQTEIQDNHVRLRRVQRAACLGEVSRCADAVSLALEVDSQPSSNASLSSTMRM